MSVHDIDKLQVPELENVLLWDALEGVWRIGHARVMIEGVPAFWCDCTVVQAADLIVEELPVPVLVEVSHWARLPDQPGLPA